MGLARLFGYIFVPARAEVSWHSHGGDSGWHFIDGGALISIETANFHLRPALPYVILEAPVGCELACLEEDGLDLKYRRYK